MSRRFWKTADSAPPLSQPEHRVPRDIFGGSSSGTTTVHQNADPWSGVQPYMRDIFAQGAANYYGTPTTFSQQPTFMGGSVPSGLGGGGMFNKNPMLGMVSPAGTPQLGGSAQLGSGPAPMNPYTAQAIQAQANRAQAGSPLLPAAQAEIQKTISGGYLTPDSNPYLQGAVNQALGDVQSRMSGLFSGDNFGGSSHQEWLGKTLANTALPIYAQNYQTERGRQIAAAGEAPRLAAADYNDIGQLAAAGEAQTAYPWQQLARYQQSISGGLGAGGSSSTQQPYFTNPAANALGLGIGGLGLYNGLGAAGLLGGGAAATTGAVTAADLIPLMFL